MPSEGEWTLGVLDGLADGSNGTVNAWSLEVETRPCAWQSALRYVPILFISFCMKFYHARAFAAHAWLAWIHTRPRERLYRCMCLHL